MLPMFCERERVSGNATLGSSRQCLWEVFRFFQDQPAIMFPEGHRDGVTAPFESA